jgi:hypothetical protein
MIAFLLKQEIKTMKENKSVSDDSVSSQGAKLQDGKFHKKAAAKAKKQALIAKSALASLLAKVPDEAEVLYATLFSIFHPSLLFIYVYVLSKTLHTLGIIVVDISIIFTISISLSCDTYISIDGPSHYCFVTATY